MLLVVGIVGTKDKRPDRIQLSGASETLLFCGRAEH